MARGTTTRRITRLDREAASAGAASFDLGLLVRPVLVVVALLVLLVVLAVAAPDSRSVGGPLQDGSLPASVQTVRKVGDGAVSIGVFVPWNTADGTALLEAIVPVGAEGVRVVKTGVLPPGTMAIDPSAGFPPGGVRPVRVDGWGMPPGGGPLDDVQIVIGLQGRGYVLGFVLRYQQGGTTYHAFLPQGVMLCAASCEGRAEVQERQRQLVAQLSPYVDAPSR